MKKKVPTEKEIAKKHGVSVDYVTRQAEIGSTVEREHVTTHEEAYGIALQHIDEFPDYYKHLLKMEKKLKSEWKNGKKAVKEEKEEVRYCHLCEKDETKSECRYGPNAWEMATRLKIDEDHKEIASGAKLDDEGYMANLELDQMQRSIEILRKVIRKPKQQLPAWVQSKITRAADFIDTAADYMQSDETVSEGVRPKPVDKPLSLKDFKSRRRSNTNRQASDDARKRGHEGKEWHNTGRTYSPDEAKSRRANMSDYNRQQRHQTAVDPDNDNADTYSASKTKNPKKIRKQQAMGEDTQKSFDDFMTEAAAWTRKSGKNPSGGLNEKGRKSYERENPGSDLKAPSKKVGNPRRASFCARMKGMKSKLTSAKTANDPDSRINKSLRAWNC